MHTRPRPIALPLFLSILTLILHGQVVAQDTDGPQRSRHRQASRPLGNHAAANIAGSAYGALATTRGHQRGMVRSATRW